MRYRREVTERMWWVTLVDDLPALKALAKETSRRIARAPRQRLDMAYKGQVLRFKDVERLRQTLMDAENRTVPHAGSSQAKPMLAELVRDLKTLRDRGVSVRARVKTRAAR